LKEYMNVPIPGVERLHGGRPILEKCDDHPWENRVVFNTACVLVDTPERIKRLAEAMPVDGATRAIVLKERAVVALLYRAQGTKTAEKDHTHSTLGLAVCTPDLRLLVRLPEPVMLPVDRYDNLGVEDPRITRVGDQFVMVYTGYAAVEGGNQVRIILATSTDLVHWKKHGPLRGPFNAIDNKNGMLFEAKPGKPWLILHRPMEGKDKMTVHWAESTHLFGDWTDRGKLLPWIPNPRFKDVWTGGGAPPLLLPNDTYLVVYHIGNRDAEGQREYDLGIALIDPDAPVPVLLRAEPLLVPETPQETTGDEGLGVNNVVFICGAYFWEGDLYFPYQGSDTRILGARIPRGELDKFLNARP
jgi:predicted GH43/DUF377 family glycosyl hydrolase